MQDRISHQSVSGKTRVMGMAVLKSRIQVSILPSCWLMGDFQLMRVYKEEPGATNQLLYTEWLWKA